MSGLYVFASFVTFLAGWIWRGFYERHLSRSRRGGYIRQVPMASAHPWRSASIEGFHNGAESYRRRFTNRASVHLREPKS